MSSSIDSKKALRPVGYYEDLLQGIDSAQAIGNVLTQDEEFLDEIIKSWVSTFVSDFDDVSVDEFDERTMYIVGEIGDARDEDTGEELITVLDQSTATSILESMQDQRLPLTFQNGEEMTAENFPELKTVLARVAKEYPHWILEEYALSSKNTRKFPTFNVSNHDYALTEEESEVAQKYLVEEREKILSGTSTALSDHLIDDLSKMTKEYL